MKTKSAIALGLLLATSGVFAYEPGDIILRAGAALVSPDEGSDGVAIPAIGQAAINGTEAKVSDDTQLGLTLNYMFTSQWGVEVLAATPFEHDIEADLSAAGFGVVDAGSTKHLPPTVSVVYYPFGSSDVFKPYVGVGLNYTVFFDEDVDPSLEAAAPTVVNAIAGAGTLPNEPVAMKLSLKESFGLALQVGSDMELGDNWLLNASVRWVDINTDASFSSALGETITVDNVEIDPFVYQLNIGYLF